MVFQKKIIFDRISFTSRALLVVSFLITAFSLLFYGEYSKKVMVQGYVEESQGEYLAIAPIDGQIVTKHFSLNERVKKDDLLFTISHYDLIKSDNTTVISSKDKIKQHYAQLRDSMKVSINDVEVDSSDFIVQIDKKVTSSLYSDRINKSIIEDLDAQIKSLESRIEKYDASKILSESQTDQYKDTLEKLKIQKKNAQNQEIKNKIYLEDLKENKIKVLSQKKEKINNLSNRIQESHLNEQRTFNQSNRNFFSTLNGKITMDTVHVGKSIRRGDLLLRVSKSNEDGSLFIGRLLLNNEAVAHIKKNHALKVKFDSFPYATYGAFNAKVVEIQKSPTLPSSIIYTKSLDSKKGMVFLANIEFDSQQLQKHHINLMTGMTFSADIKTKKRNLIEWLFEPYFEAKNRKFSSQ